MEFVGESAARSLLRWANMIREARHFGWRVKAGLRSLQTGAPLRNNWNIQPKSGDEWKPVADAGAAVTIKNLVKRYGTVLAVDDVSFSIHEGEIFGIIGPNGAGKTTTVECISAATSFNEYPWRKRSSSTRR